MTIKCSIKKCVRPSGRLCDCCRQNICFQHLNEHNMSLVSRLYPLTDELNLISNRLETLDTTKTFGDSREQLIQWRDDCHKRIDTFFDKRNQELDSLINQKIDQQRNEIARIRLKMTEMIRVQETTQRDINSLTSNLRRLEKKMDSMEHPCVKVITQPLIVDEILINIMELNEHELDISTISPVYSQMERSKGSFRSLTNNNQHLLLHHHPNLRLFDREMNMIKEIVWQHGYISDMSWCSALNKFIILGQKHIYLLNENTMSVDRAQTIEQYDWISCTCSDTILYLATHKQPSSIMEFTLTPKINLTKKWKYPHTCNKDETIYGIIYSNENLAILVRNLSEESVRIELRIAKTLERIWSLQLDICCVQNRVFRCSSMTCNEWLIADYETGRLLQITKDGKIKKKIQYNPRPFHAIVFDQNKLAVSTVQTVNLHKIQ